MGVSYHSKSQFLHISSLGRSDKQTAFRFPSWRHTQVLDSRYHDHPTTVGHGYVLVAYLAPVPVI